MSERKSFDAKESLNRNGQTLAALFDASQHGFNEAYQRSKSKGFDPLSAIQEGSADRVNAVYDLLNSSYGSVDVGALGGAGILTAFAVVQQLTEILQTFESFVSATPEDFVGVTEVIEQQRAQAVSAKYSGLSI